MKGTVIIALLAACSSSTREPLSDAGDADARCRPGESFSCTCPSGTAGFRVCRNDGTLADCPCSNGVDGITTDSGSCLTEGGYCRDTGETCCEGFECVFDTKDPTKALCAFACKNNGECNSGCCTVLVDGTKSVCAPAKYCAGSCSVAGESCETTSCCPNTLCVTSTVTGVSCAARCALNSQCASGCCAPLKNTGELVCSPVVFCQ